MLHLIVPFPSWLVKFALEQIPPDADLGDHLIDLCLAIIGKAVTLTSNDADDALYETVKTAIKSHQA